MTSFGKYKLHKMIGAGSNASVFLATHKSVPDLPLAIKVFHASNGELLSREIEIMRSLKHENIIQLYDVVSEGDKTGLVMEYISDGSLQDYVTQNGPISDEKFLFKVVNQLCNALYYLHNVKKVVHRDVKSENVLMCHDGRVKLADFGFSRGCDQLNNIMTTRCGSPLHTPPEIITSQKYNEKADIWSLGILIYYIVVGEFPFYSTNIQHVFHLIVESDFTFPDRVLARISPQLQDMINSMLIKDAKERPDIVRLMEHPWFSKMKLSCQKAAGTRIKNMQSEPTLRLKNEINQIGLIDNEFQQIVQQFGVIDELDEDFPNNSQNNNNNNNNNNNDSFSEKSVLRKLNEAKQDMNIQLSSVLDYAKHSHSKPVFNLVEEKGVRPHCMMNLRVGNIPLISPVIHQNNPFQIKPLVRQRTKPSLIIPKTASFFK
ncbi:CAMK family protein kinase [Tritrichomonas foetus]|uniref:CAMK family protein kinase n=1 Tax=Tritrichomonas foetus TaxID=1144522 RepID=A0A1J4JJB7_9EUKA|nr:CAMK family protein kinase [Tritrichomonas foetus]|eukprot:OHS98689.1 CAMK family protein kinase [Tritrichomonas foetus]